MADIYSIAFQNSQGDSVTCNIEDTEVATTYFYNLTGTGIVLRTTNNDENKFSVIRGTEAEIGFINSSSINLDTFATGEANRFKVTIVIEGDTIFVGHLVQDDIEEPFLHRGINEVRLIATDGLGLLKDIKLNETAFGELEGVYPLAAYLAYAISPTGTDQNINIVNNLYEASFAKRDALNTNCAFNQAYLDARTFKVNYTEWDSCYTVIEKILGNNYFLTQHLNSWWIVRVDEYYRNYPFSYTTYDSAGVIVTAAINDTTYTGDVFLSGLTALNDQTTPILQFINEDCVYSLVRPAKSVKLTYNLEQWDEVPCNNTFERGAEIADFVTYKTFALDDWTQEYNFPTGGVNTGDVYIRRNYDSLGLESQRFVVVEPETSTNEGFIKSCVIPVGENDRFTLSFDWAFSSNAAGSGGYTRQLGHLILEADDATYWTMDENGDWFQSNATWTVNLKNLQQTIELSDDQTDFINFTVDSKPIPRDGDMYLLLQSESISRYNVDVYYSDLRFEYNAYINDGYAPIESQYHKVSTTANYLKQIEGEVFVSDSPREIFKGALLKFDSPDYVLTQSWSNYDSNGAGFDDPPVIANGNFGKFQAFAVWNQEAVFQKKFRCAFYGLKNSSGDYLSILFKFAISTLPANLRYFFTTMERDLMNCEIRGTMIQVYDSNTDYDQGDGTYPNTSHEFKYLVQ